MMRLLFWLAALGLLGVRAKAFVLVQNDHYTASGMQRLPTSQRFSGSSLLLSSSSSSRLFYRRKDQDDEVYYASLNSTTAGEELGRRLDSFEEKQMGHPEQQNQVPDDQDEEEKEVEQLRQHLKQELAKVAIEQYNDYDTTSTASSGITTTTSAEDIMKQLEPLCPRHRPAHAADLNARWSFVFTGVPTIGMKLITLLSRISVHIRPIDFQNVFLEVHPGRVQATVSCVVLGVLPLELQVHTVLSAPHEDDPAGTHLLERFESVTLNGMRLPTPPAWQESARDLDIRYLDADFMIARTAGGEPHLLLRHSPCLTTTTSSVLFAEQEEEEECDIDTELTEYFAAAQTQYGADKLARSLVDRAYGRDDDDDENNDSSMSSKTKKHGSIPHLIQSILTGKDSH